jgi:hypothetical protein
VPDDDEDGACDGDLGLGLAAAARDAVVPLAEEAALIRWITPRILSELGLSAGEAFERAWSNLNTAARQAPQVTIGSVDGVTLLGFAMGLPSTRHWTRVWRRSEGVSKTGVTGNKDGLLAWALWPGPCNQQPAGPGLL